MHFAWENGKMLKLLLLVLSLCVELILVISHGYTLTKTGYFKGIFAGKKTK